MVGAHREHTVRTQPGGRTAGQKEGEAGCRATGSTEVPATGVAQIGWALMVEQATGLPP